MFHSKSKTSHCKKMTKYYGTISYDTSTTSSPPSPSPSPTMSGLGNRIIGSVGPNGQNTVNMPLRRVRHSLNTGTTVRTSPNSTSYHAGVGGNSNGGRTQAGINSTLTTQPLDTFGALYDATFDAHGNYLPGKGPPTSTSTTTNFTPGAECNSNGGRTQAGINNTLTIHPPDTFGALYDSIFDANGNYLPGKGPSTSTPITTTNSGDESTFMSTSEYCHLASNEQTNDNEAADNDITNNNNDGNSTNDYDGSTLTMNSPSNSNHSYTTEPVINLETLEYCPPATADQSNNNGTTPEGTGNNNNDDGSMMPVENSVGTTSDTINNHDQHQQDISSNNTNTSESTTQPTSDQYDQASHIAAFAAKLKTIENGVIVDFDVALLRSTCMKISPSYDSSIDIALLASELFKCGETWVNRDLLLTSVRAYGESYGFEVKADSVYIQCLAFGKKEYKKNYSAGPLRVGCTWRLLLKPSVNIKMEGKSKKKPRYKPNWDCAVTIKDGSCCEHGGLCEPNRTNLVVARQRTGKYTANINTQVLFNLCNMYENYGRLTSGVIKNVCSPMFPITHPMTKNDVFNIRIKIRRLLPTLRAAGGDYDQFKQVVNASTMLQGIENQPDIDDDEAYALATELWLETLNDYDFKAGTQGYVSFSQYLELLKQGAKGFAYELAVDENGQIMGILWQTATMRDNIERFGKYQSIDMMPRGINILLWQYVSVAMYNELNQVCLGCEGIILWEKKKAYAFLVQFLAKNTPKLKLEDVKVVSGDGFFNQAMIEEFGYVNAKFIADWYHLFDSGLDKLFGKACKKLLDGHLPQLIKAESEAHFEHVLASAFTLLKSQPSPNAQWEHDLQQFADLRSTYAQYCLNTIPGSRGRHGSSSVEQNHSSALCFLNDGLRGENNYCEDPVTLIKDLHGRQWNHVQKWNQILHKQDLQMRVEVNRLEILLESQPTPTNYDLLQAAKVLCHADYGRYKEERFIADNELVLSKAYSIEKQCEVFSISSISRPYDPPIQFQSLDEPCTCVTAVTQEMQCACKIFLKNGFDASDFESRHFRRKKVVGSLSGWVPPSTDALHAITGYVQEDLPSPDTDDGTLLAVPTAAAIAQPPMAPAMNNNNNKFQTFKSMKTNAGARPLGKDIISKMSANIIGKYSVCDSDTRFAISDALIKLEQLVCSSGGKGKGEMVGEGADTMPDLPAALIGPILQDIGASEAEETVTRYSSALVGVTAGGHIPYHVHYPHSSVVKEAPKSRCRRACDSGQPSNKRRKLDKSIQRSGISQIVDFGAGEAVIANSKTTSKCTFCHGLSPKENHQQYTSCPERRELKLHRQEYILSANDPSVKSSLSDRILYTMPVTGVAESSRRPYSQLSEPQLRASFIIDVARWASEHAANACAAMRRIEFMTFEVRFIGENGMPTQSILIDGKCMNSIITHDKKTRKFVFDGTIQSVGMSLPHSKLNGNESN